MAKDKRNKGGQEPREVDIAADPNLLWRWAKTVVAGFGNDLGGRLEEIGLIQNGLNTLERFIGGEAVGWALTLAAATVQEPEWLKRVVKYFGLPKQVNEIIEEFIDDIFEGLRMKYNERGKVTHVDANAALEAARSKLRARLEKMTFVEVTMFLDPSEQAELSQRIAAFTQSEDNGKRFEAARLKINHPRVLRTLIKLPLTDWAGYLDQLFGKTQQTQTSGVLRALEGVGSALASALQSVTKPITPEEQAALDERERRDRSRIEEIRTRRTERKW